MPLDWKRWLGGDDAGALARDIVRLGRRDRLSDYLPWLYYDPKHRWFLNVDDTLGVLWECSPLLVMGDKALDYLTTLVARRYPEGTLMQVTLYADDNIDPFLARFRGTRQRPHAMVDRLTDEYERFLRQGSAGIDHNHGTPARHFRVFVTLKMPCQPDPRLLSDFEETLRAAGLHPHRCDGGDLCQWLREFFNDSHRERRAFDPRQPLRRQLIHPDQPYRLNGRTAQLGQNRYGVCLTPDVLCSEGNDLDTLMTNGMFGGLAENINQQLTGPFLYTLNLFYGFNEAWLNMKYSYMMMNRAFGSFIIRLKKTADEYTRAFETLNKGKPLVRALPVIWLWNRSEQQLDWDTSRLASVWEVSTHMEPRRERLLNAPLLIAALPFGLYDTGDNLATLGRDFLVPSQTAACLMPVQGDFQGSPNPVVPFMGRKGQVFGLDVFDKRAAAHNFLVVGSTGVGKTFYLNWMMMNYYGTGAKVRMIDLGGGYKKLAKLFGERFIDIGPDSALSLNPFDFTESHAGDEQSRQEDRNSCIDAIGQVVTEMAYSASGGAPTETEYTLISQAIDWALDQGRRDDGLDAVYEYLSTYPQQAPEQADLPPHIQDQARQLAFNLQAFISTGRYGRYFTGRRTLDIAQDDFVVLELDRLRNHRELCTVVLMQILNTVTQDLYLSDRSTPRFIVFEEVVSLLQDQGVSDLSLYRLTSIINQGYMRARKYYGSFGVVIQSLLMMKQRYPDMFENIWTNSDYKFLMPDDYDSELAQGVLHYQDTTANLLRSLEYRSGRYSDVWIDAGKAGLSVGRVLVDPLTYWINTSKGTEVARFEELLASGLSTAEALDALSNQVIAEN